MKALHRYQEMRFNHRVLHLVHFEYPVVKQTRCGAWIDVCGRLCFVRLDAHKRFACPTKAEALESYQARKRRQVALLRAQLAEAEAALELKHEDDVWFGALS